MVELRRFHFFSDFFPKIYNAHVNPSTITDSWLKVTLSAFLSTFSYLLLLLLSFFLFADVASFFLFRNNGAMATARWTGNAKVRPLGFLSLHFGPVLPSAHYPILPCYTDHSTPRSRVNYATGERENEKSSEKTRGTEPVMAR